MVFDQGVADPPTLLRVLGALSTAAALMVGLALPYFVLHRYVVSGLLALGGLVVAVIVVRRVAVRHPGFIARGALVGAIIVLVVVANIWPYRDAVTAWGLTPETPPAQWAIGILYVASAAVGGFLGSFVLLRVAPRVGDQSRAE